MTDGTTTFGHEDPPDEALLEALANVWFQGLVLAILALVFPLLVGFEIALWQWPILLAIPVVAWWFGGWYGRFNVEDGDSGLL